MITRVIGMDIEIIGPESEKCLQLAFNAEMAAQDLRIDIRLKKNSDIKKMASYGIFFPPGLVVNGTVMSIGRVPSREDLKRMFLYVINQQKSLI